MYGCNDDEQSAVQCCIATLRQSEARQQLQTLDKHDATSAWRPDLQQAAHLVRLE